MLDRRILSNTVVARDANHAPSIPDAISLDREDFTNSPTITRASIDLSLKSTSPDENMSPRKDLPLSLRLPLVSPFTLECRAGGRIYELLGVRFFQKWMPTIDKLHKSPLSTEKRDLDEKDRESRLRRFSNATTVFEGCHIVVGAWFMLNALSDMQSGNVTSALMNTSINVLVNLYPIMSQRYNRVRILSILNKQMQNKSGKRIADAPAS